MDTNKTAQEVLDALAYFEAEGEKYSIWPQPNVKLLAERIAELGEDNKKLKSALQDEKNSKNILVDDLGLLLADIDNPASIQWIEDRIQEADGIFRSNLQLVLDQLRKTMKGKDND